MLATTPTRAEGVRVVSPARIHDLPRWSGTSDAAAAGSPIPAAA
jgi:hypothetical protein